MILSINFPKEGMILVNINNRGSVRLFVHTYRMRVLIFAGKVQESDASRAINIYAKFPPAWRVLSTGTLSSIRNRKTVEKKSRKTAKKLDQTENRMQNHHNR